jgi:DNA modification methylase
VPSFSLMVGDVFEQLALLPNESVDCVVTSPPYWGLRDYGYDGQIGMESTLAEHMQVMVQVFSAVRRVMKPQASLWLNYGDCYATKPNGRSTAATKQAGNDDRTFRDKPMSTVQGVLKPKDLCMLPNRLAIALQEDGWWVRAENIWGKPNPMPDSSGRYRPSTAHEKVFLLTKSANSFYDEMAVKMPASPKSLAQYEQPYMGTDTKDYAAAGAQSPSGIKARIVDKQRGHSRRHAGFNDRWDLMTKEEQQANGRLLRNYEPDLSAIVPVDVWNIPTASFSDAHFATFPPALVYPCIASSCPVGGTVLDPFGGAGTVALVAQRLGRSSILIEMSPEYAEIAERRVRNGDIGFDFGAAS